MNLVEPYLAIQPHKHSDNPYIKRCAESLGMTYSTVKGLLVTLWMHAISHVEDGDFSDFDDDWIMKIAEYPEQMGKHDMKDGQEFPSRKTVIEALRANKLMNGKLLGNWLELAGPFLEEKYAATNPSKLFAIWKKHGEMYLPSDTNASIFLPVNQSVHAIQISGDNLDQVEDFIGADRDSIQSLSEYSEFSTTVGDANTGDWAVRIGDKHFIVSRDLFPRVWRSIGTQDRTTEQPVTIDEPSPANEEERKHMVDSILEKLKISQSVRNEMMQRDISPQQLKDMIEDLEREKQSGGIKDVSAVLVHRLRHSNAE